jgi:hypothetical protein
LPLRGVITDDGVISEAEAQSIVGKLAATFTAAKTAIQAGTAQTSPVSHFEGLVAELDNSLSAGVTMPMMLGDAFLTEARQLGIARRAKLQDATSGHADPILERMASISGGPSLI